MPLPAKRVAEDVTTVSYTTVIPRFSVFAVAGSQTVPPPEFTASNLVISPTQV